MAKILASDYWDGTAGIVLTEDGVYGIDDGYEAIGLSAPEAFRVARFILLHKEDS